MDAEKLQHYRALLTKIRDEIRAEIDAPDSESKPVQLDGTMGRIARMEAIGVQQMALGVKRQREERLKQIDIAFKRMDQNVYGVCPRCRQAISDARLEAFPEIVTCINCANG